MSGISSKALNFGNPENKKKFIHQELDDDLGLNWYQFKFRNHDPQIGRFVEIDPLADKYEYNSPYAYAENKLGKGFDLEGLELAEFNVNRDVSDVQSGKINADQLKERQEVRGNAQAAGTALGVGLGLSFLYPQTAQVVFASVIFGVPSPEAPTSMISTVAAEGNTVVNEVKTATSTVTENAAKGKEFEKTVVSNLAKDGHTNIAEQVTVKANNGVKTRIDVVSKDANGNIVLTEAKSSATAPLTKNQQAAHPSIAQTGGVVVGEGKPGFPGGTQIPPAKVNVVRPKFPLE